MLKLRVCRSLQKHHHVKRGCGERIAPTLRDLLLERYHLLRSTLRSTTFTMRGPFNRVVAVPDDKVE